MNSWKRKHGNIQLCQVVQFGDVTTERRGGTKNSQNKSVVLNICVNSSHKKNILTFINISRHYIMPLFAVTLLGHPTWVKAKIKQLALLVYCCTRWGVWEQRALCDSADWTLISQLNVNYIVPKYHGHSDWLLSPSYESCWKWLEITVTEAFNSRRWWLVELKVDKADNHRFDGWCLVWTFLYQCTSIQIRRSRMKSAVSLLTHCSHAVNDKINPPAIQNSLHVKNTHSLMTNVFLCWVTGELKITQCSGCSLVVTKEEAFLRIWDCRTFDGLISLLPPTDHSPDLKAHVKRLLSLLWPFNICTWARP